MTVETFRLYHDKTLDELHIAGVGRVKRFQAWQDGITALAVTVDGSAFGGVTENGRCIFVELTSEPVS